MALLIRSIALVLAEAKILYAKKKSVKTLFFFAYRILHMINKIDIFVFCGLMILAWLMPNHYSPWLAFHSDWVSCAAVVFSFIISINLFYKNYKIPIISIFVFLFSLVPIFQYIFGLIYFKGDAIIVFAYLFMAALASILGRNFSCGDEDFYKYLSLSLLFAGIISLWIALNQWLAIEVNGIYSVQIPFKGRIYANFAQPNQFATFLMLGLCAIFYLFQKKYINSIVAIIISSIFCFGLSLAQSRAGFLEVFIFCTLGGWFCKWDYRKTFYFVLVLFLFLLCWFYILPWANEILMTSGVRSDQTAVGTRPIHWKTALHAISLSPLYGYGWNQVSVALSQSVNFYAPTYEFIEHSHNLILDILLWNGIPLMILMLVFFVFWIYYFLINHFDKNKIFPLLFITCLLVHAMLEFPLEYAYFLLPFFVVLGYLEKNEKTFINIKISMTGKIFISLSLIISLFTVARDYLIVEINTNLLRLQDRGLNVDEKDFSLNEIKLFDQQRNFIKFAKTVAKENMNYQEVEWMRKVSMRYGYAPALFRYALAAGLNGNPVEANNALLRICKTSSISNCLESRVSWNKLRERYIKLPKHPMDVD